MWPVIALMAAATVYKAASANKEGKEGQRLHNARADMALLDAVGEREAAAVRAFSIRRLTADARSGARAGFAAAGVEVDRGTAEFVDRAVIQEFEYAAGMELLMGERRAQHFEQEAEFETLSGESARRAGRRNAFGSLLGGAAQIAGTAWGGGKT
jgi:hypothetical protein